MRMTISSAPVTLALAILTCIAHPHRSQAQQETFERDIAGAAESMARQLSGMTVAVFDFPDLEGRVSNLSRLVSEEFTTGLVQHLEPNGTIVERHQVLQVITELELQETDLTAQQMSRAGRQLGADAIILGTTAVLGQQIVVNLRAVDVERGRVIVAARVRVRGTRELLAMASEGHGGPSLTPRPATNPSSGNTTSSSSNSPGGGAHTSSTSASASGFTQQAGAVDLRLESCRQTGDGIRCDFVATASRDGHFGIVWMGFLDNGPIFSRNRIVDSQGNEHNATEIGTGGNLKNFGDANVELVAGVPVRASVQFSGVEEAVSLPLLEVQVWTNERAYALRYRNIQLSR